MVFYEFFRIPLCFRNRIGERDGCILFNFFEILKVVDFDIGFAIVVFCADRDAVILLIERGFEAEEAL